MNLLSKHFSLKGSVSCFAITIALSGTLFYDLSMPEALAQNTINYTGGTDSANQLINDPTGNNNQFKSLFGQDVGTSQNIVTENIITVGDTTAANKVTWNTNPDNGSVIAPYVIYGGVDVEAARVAGSANGVAGKDIINNIITMDNIAYDWSGVGNKAPDGVSGSGTALGGGVGGMGSGSVYGGLSIGGVSGSGWSVGANRVSGGIGGSVSGNQIMLTNVQLKGGLGGAGGAGNNRDLGGAGGFGGMGGASIYGGVSIGGAGGSGGRGGTGGTVSGNLITLINVILVGGAGGNGGAGAKGGDGGSSGGGGGGFGGFGGGSIYGGISLGSTGGDGGGIGGTGGVVQSNRVTLIDVTLTGGVGGNGNLGGSGGTGGIGGGSIFGGLSIGGGGGGDAGIGGAGGLVSGNEVILTNAQLIGMNGGSGGDSDYGAIGINGLSGGSIYGGVSFGGGSGFHQIGGAGGNVSGNEVTLTNVQLTAVAGNSSDFRGGSVYGGLSIGGSGGMGRAGGVGGNVTSNRVKILRGTLIWGDVYGGYSHGGTKGTGSVAVDGVGGAAINNIVTLEGNEIKIGERDGSGNIISYGSIWGGRSVNGDGTESNDFAKVISGNTLKLVGYRGRVNGIYNFENYNWTLPNDVQNNDVLITVSDPVQMDNTTHRVLGMQEGGSNRLYVGDTVTLISQTQGTLASSNMIQHFYQGQFIYYDATLTQTQNPDKALVLTIGTKIDNTPTPKPTPAPEPDRNENAARVNPQSKSYSEGRAAALGFVNQGGDLISMGLGGIRGQAFTQGSKKTIIPFMIMNGSSQRNKTGSHVDIKGFNMAIGVATGFEFSVGHKTTLGAFFEYGRGTYDTFNSFTNFASVYGDGDANYKGVGIFSRIDFANTGLGHVANLAADQADGIYIEASIRAGRTSSHFDAGNNMTSFGMLEGAYRGSYDSKSHYYGGHVAGGYVFNFDEKQLLDIYGRYLWTHMDGDTVSIGNEKLRFDSATSSRIQIGGRYAYSYNAQLKPYIGAAYEYEFDGKIAAKAYEFSLDRPSLKGSSGIFEVGLNFQPITANRALSIDLNAHGYVGQRQGGGGGLKIKYQF